ncbi:MAG TPA: hypothetical protein VJ990_10180 [Clostridia bacterium]|nr:hypothetical protein [Clostridia bacterium]
MMRYFGYYPHYFNGGGLMMIFGLLLVAILIYWVIKKSPVSPGAAGSTNAIDLLDEKFALGEISDEEYLKKKKLLKK